MTIRHLAAVLAVGLLVFHSAWLQPWTLDDAFITVRYAQNLADGVGPVYNPGEWVDGYTTPLWMGLLALVAVLGFDPVVGAKALGFGLAACVVVGLALQRRWMGGPAAALMLGSSGVFTAWAMPGMEVPLVALTTCLAVATTLRGLEKDPVWAGVFCALAMLVRPDAAVVVSVCMGLLVWERGAVGLRAWAAWSVLYAPWFFGRWALYGWPLPNTFYAKVGGTAAQLSRGEAYVEGAVGLLWPMLILAWLGFFGTRDRGVWWMLPMVGLHGLYVMTVGGDVMPAYRFFAGVLPLIAVLAGTGVTLLGPRVGPMALAVVVVFNLVQFHVHDDLVPRIRKGVVGRNGEEVGRFLQQTFPADTLLATNTAGSVAYFSGFRTIDMLGLNDATIAHRAMPGMGTGLAGHEKADGAYVWGRQPDIVQFGSARGRARPVFTSDRELFAMPGFREQYSLRTYSLPSGATLTLWVRSDR